MLGHNAVRRKLMQIVEARREHALACDQCDLHGNDGADVMVAADWHNRMMKLIDEAEELLKQDPPLQKTG